MHQLSHVYVKSTIILIHLLYTQVYFRPHSFEVPSFLRETVEGYFGALSYNPTRFMGAGAGAAGKARNTRRDGEAHAGSRNSTKYATNTRFLL
jgi:hypothetical protein